MLVLLLLTNCTATEPFTPIQVQLDSSNQNISTLKQVSDYPLYELHFIGDYGFKEYIQTGIQSTSQRVIPRASAYACACFAASGDEEHVIFGRNFDWYEHPALILFTDSADGYASVSMVDLYYVGYDENYNPLDHPEELSEAPYLPADGMNEHGLAVGMMAVPHAEGGDDPQKVTLGSLEMIRLMMDYAGDVEEAWELIQDYNVDFGSVPVHYLIADATGNSTVIEYLEGKPVRMDGGRTWQVATNFLISFEKPQGADSSCWRYNHLYSALMTRNGALDESDGMQLLQDVSQPGDETSTCWSIIYDLTNKKISLAMGREYNMLYEYSLGKY
jgi:hypothetical protein